jgi:hypothetical protein
MNCIIVQRRLLSLENPRHPPAELLAHLAGCAGCRDWLRRFVEMERSVPLLPVPATTAREAFLGRILTGEVMPRREVPPVRRPVAGRIDGQRRARGMRKAALAVALAAGLVLFVVIVAAMRNHKPTGSGRPAADPLLASLLKRDLRLAEAPPPSERAKALVGLADDLQGQTDALARPDLVEDLKALAGWYKDVVQKAGAVALRQDVSAEQRRALASQLEEERGKMELLARDVSEGCRLPLRDMATAAGDVSRSLQPDAQSFRPGRNGPAALARTSGGGPLPGCFPAVVLASVARAQPPAVPLVPAERARRFQQNRGLIGKLVTGGLSLAGEENPLKRAVCCNGIAESMADEMRDAAERRERDRVAELGKHLQSLLKGGVADNLSKARTSIPSGSAEEKELEKVRTDTEGFVKPLQQVIHAADADDIQGTSTAVRDGLESVEKAVIRQKP